VLWDSFTFRMAYNVIGDGLVFHHFTEIVFIRTVQYSPVFSSERFSVTVRGKTGGRK
jgi:hypothetical protein